MCRESGIGCIKTGLLEAKAWYMKQRKTSNNYVDTKMRHKTEEMRAFIKNRNLLRTVIRDFRILVSKYIINIQLTR